MCWRDTSRMVTATLLAMMFGLLAVLLVSVALRDRSTARAKPAGSASAEDTAWMPVIFSGGTDCAAGDVGGDVSGDDGAD